MASASTSTLTMLVNLAGEEVDLATKNLAEASQALKAEQEKKAMLQTYKQDYIDQYNAQLSNGLGKELHLNYQLFLQNLQQAIDGQEEMVIVAKYERDKKREALQKAQQKKMSFEVLISRAEKKALRTASKREQKLMDEFAMRVKSKHAN
jgi:flagellar protein FliJ